MTRKASLLPFFERTSWERWTPWTSRHQLIVHISSSFSLKTYGNVGVHMTQVGLHYPPPLLVMDLGAVGAGALYRRIAHGVPLAPLL